MDEKDLLKKSLVSALKKREPKNEIHSLIEKLIQQKVQIEKMKDVTGTPLLNIAIDAAEDSKNSDVISLLLRHGANPLLTDKHGQTALHAAACVDNVDALWLIAMRTDIKQLLSLKNSEGDTLLHVAARRKCVDTAQWLMFAGADPMTLNKESQTCRQVAPDNLFMIKHILRKTRENESVPLFLTSEKAKSFRSRNGHFSIALNRGHKSAASSKVTAVAMIRTKAPQNLNPPITCYDGETFWGHGIEYMSRTTTQAKVKFFLHDRVDTFHRLVIKIKSEEKEEMEYDATVEDFSPLGEQLHSSVEMVSINNSPYVAVAWAHVELDKSGSVSLVYGPPVDTIELGPEGGTFEFSRNPGVKLSATTNQGTIPERTKINMQVTKAPPLNPPPPEPSAGESGEAAEARVSTQPVVAMTDFLHLRGPSSLADTTQLSLRATLPLCEQFSKDQSQAYVFVRHDGRTKDNLDEEEKHWTLSPETLTLKRDDSNVVISTAINQMATVVQVSRSASLDEAKREVANQHIKSRQVAVQFYVREKQNQNQSVKNGNSSSSKKCRLEITVKAQEEGSWSTQSQDKSDNYKVSDIVYVPHQLRMRIWLHQENFESPLPSGHIVFQHGVHTEPIGNNCWFDARRQETKQTRIILKIEKSKLLEQCDQMNWKPLIDLEVCIPPFKPVSSSPEPETPVNETFDVPIDDQLLSHLARRIPPTEIYRLGIELQLDSCFVENILHSSHAHDYFTKCFMILRAARDSCRLPKDFVELLRAALTGLQLISQLEWLLRELGKRKESEPQWEHFSRLPVI